MASLAPYLALGSQMAAFVVVLGAVGWLIDQQLGTEPWALIIGLILGCVVGFSQFLRNVQRLLKRDQEQRTKDQN